MGYPQQPQGPYGQQQPPQYGYQPPPGPPRPPRRNVGLIVALAVGLALLLLAGGCAVLLALSNPSRVITRPDSPGAQRPSSVAPTNEPSAAKQQPSSAKIGEAITLQGFDPGLKISVTVNQVVSPATPAQDFIKPKSGNRFVAVQVTLTNVGQAVYTDSPTNGAFLIDGDQQQHRSTFGDVREGQSFGGTATINTGDARKGMIVYEVPEGAKLVKFQFALNSGMADQKGEWVIG